MENYFKNETSICEFMHETGLENVSRTKQITNLVDYVFGVEVGLDTNARKNRGGNIMAEAIARKFRDAGVPFRHFGRTDGILRPGLAFLKNGFIAAYFVFSLVGVFKTDLCA